MSRISLIHATPLAIAPVVAAFRDEWPDASVFNFLEDSLTTDLKSVGSIDDSIVQRFHALARYATETGADGILFTCSAFGAAIESVAEKHPFLPVLKPNEAMFEEALERGNRIAMIATFEPSVPSMQREFEAMAQRINPKATLETACVPRAMDALASGDTETHNQLIAAAAKEFADRDVLMLAQFSMASARANVMENVSIPVLTSPMSAVRKLRLMLGAS
ncbi:MAG: aspartate/glutamate racemase family protein [Alphaproteobacteria bacterium]